MYARPRLPDLLDVEEVLLAYTAKVEVVITLVDGGGGTMMFKVDKALIALDGRILGKEKDVKVGNEKLSPI